MGSTGAAPLIRNLGIRWRRMVNVTDPAALPPRRNFGTYTIVDWVDPRAGVQGNSIFPPPGFEPLTVQFVV